MSQLEDFQDLIPPGILEADPRTRQILNQGLIFWNGVARELQNVKNLQRVSGVDFLVAMQAANVGIRHDPIITNKTVGAGEEILDEDIIPFLPNSRLVFYLQLSGVNSTVSLVTKLGENAIDGLVLDNTPFVVGVPREFNVPVSRDQKFNLKATAGVTIDLIKIIEFRIGL